MEPRPAGFCAGSACQAVNLASNTNCGSFGEMCPSDTQCREGVCATIFGEPSACDAGACGTGQVCVGSLCVAQVFGQSTDDSPCALDAGTGLCCAGVCTDVSRSGVACGSCGVVCGPDAGCAAGQCAPVACAPDGGFEAVCALPGGAGVCCGGACLDVSSDTESCGGCGISCPTGQGCTAGRCSPGCTTSSDCAANTLCVNGQCLPTGCSVAQPETACAVAVSPGLSESGICCGPSCVMNAYDPNNCGACGVSCAGAACVDGTCTGLSPLNNCPQLGNEATCVEQGQAGECCAGVCTFADDANCGSCGLICPVGTHCAATATGAACFAGGAPANCAVNGCDAGQACSALGTFCVALACSAATEGEPCGRADGGGGTCCGSACVALEEDPQNCDACGLSCGGLCSAGRCETGCADGGCSPGDVCSVYGICLSPSCGGAGDGRECAFGLSVAPGQASTGQCCNQRCVDVTHDPLNCGACDLLCSQGLCLGLGFTATCVRTPPIATCAMSCAPGTFCDGQGCAAVGCATAFSLCGGADGRPGVCCPEPGNLTCANVLIDSVNCGGCGVVCPDGQACGNGICVDTPAPCSVPGRTGSYCNLDAGLGFVCCPGLGCVDVANDPVNCGACGAHCDAGASCLAGACQP